MLESLKILIVDDNEEFCRNLEDILELRGFTATTAYSGRQALDLANENPFDLVLMDVKMPVMDGVETLKKLKRINPDITVVMVTAYAVDELIREALREGAFGVLSKPLDFDKLFNIIDEATDDGGLILVADDDPNLCWNMADVLVKKGYRVDVAKNGSEAIRKTKEKDFDLVLLDMKMPAMNGLEVYLEVRDIRPEVVVIVITGFAHEVKGLAEQTVEQNAYVWLEKPLDLDYLMELIHKIEKQKAEGCLIKPRVYRK